MCKWKRRPRDGMFRKNHLYSRSKPFPRCAWKRIRKKNFQTRRLSFRRVAYLFAEKFYSENKISLGAEKRCQGHKLCYKLAGYP